MPVTRQITRQSGGDIGTSSRTARSTQAGSNKIGKSTTNQTQNEGRSVTTRTSQAVQRTTTTTTAATTQTQQEDKGFTLSFSVKILSALPCKEIPPFS